MAYYTIYSETGITADTDSTVFAIPKSKGKYTLQVIWANMAGAGDGTFELQKSLIADSGFQAFEKSQIITVATSGVQIYNITSYEGGFIKLVYTENTNTSIDLKILSTTNFGKVR